MRPEIGVGEDEQFAGEGDEGAGVRFVALDQAAGECLRAALQ
jgi:hypothetical protein